MATSNGLRLLAILGYFSVSGIVLADSWQFDPVEKSRVETFGSTRIVLTTDARQNQQYPDFILNIYYQDELRARRQGMAFDKIFASPDHSHFLGLSNRGLPGTAIILFDQYGNLLLEVRHSPTTFDYCKESVTLVRQWFDEEIPNVQFVANETNADYRSITVRGCRGNRIDLLALAPRA